MERQENEGGKSPEVDDELKVRQMISGSTDIALSEIVDAQADDTTHAALPSDDSKIQPDVQPDEKQKVEKSSGLSIVPTATTGALSRMLLKDQAISEVHVCQKDPPFHGTEVGERDTEAGHTNANNEANQRMPENQAAARDGGQTQVPGAYAMAPSPDLNSQQSGHSDPQEQARQTRTSTLEDGLPVANQVSDTLDLPVADVDHPRQGMARTKKQFPLLPAILYGICLAVLVIVVAVLVRSNRNNEDTDNIVTDMPTSSPVPPNDVQNLSDVELFVKETFPNYTLDALKDAVSPQFLAYQWIVEDVEENGYTLTSRLRQRYALATLYYATRGDDWFDNKNWLSKTIHECFWFFQVDDRNFTPCEIPLNFLNVSSQAVHTEYGPYQRMSLSSNDLRGTLPLEVFWLTDLKEFSLNKNSGLIGPISSHIGMLDKLEEISFSHTSISGTIPTELGLLSNSLDEISIFKADIEGTIPSELGLLQRLEQISLDGNMITGTLPEELGNATNLDFLVLIQNFLSGTIPGSIWQLPFDVLGLGRNELTGSIPTDIGLLSNLTYLSLSYNGFSGGLPSQIGLLTDCINFNLYYSPFGGTIPTEFGQLSSADYFGLTSTSLTGTLPTEIGLSAALTQFWARGNNLTGTLPSEFGQLSGLDGFAVTGNTLTGTIPTEFEELQLLRLLILDNNNFSGSLPKVLSHNLELLHLTNNTLLTGTLPSNLTSLNHLEVMGTKISGTLPNYLCSIETLLFDCSLLLCGCGCSCLNETNSTSATVVST